MVIFGLILFEWKSFINFIDIRETLELLLVDSNLLLEILHSLSHIFGNFKIMLNFFHRSSSFGLLKSILGKCLMSVLKLANFILFQIYFSHFPMIVRQFFIIIVVSRLLLFLKIVDRLFVFFRTL